MINRLLPDHGCDHRSLHPRAAEILGEDEDLLWQPSDTLDPEDGVLWIHDINEQQTLAFTRQGIDNLREPIHDRVHPTG